MNRAIKIKCVRKEGEKYTVYAQTNLIDLWNVGISSYASMQQEQTSFDNKELFFIQFTGLTDKNGKDIYEGDVYMHNNRKWLIKYSENQFVLLSKEVGSKTNWRSLEDINRMKKYIQVIGNIYEHPELLTLSPSSNSKKG